MIGEIDGVYTILLSGKMGSGKTTTQKLLTDDLRALLPNMLVGCVNFADALKRECAFTADVPVDTFNTEEGKNKIVFANLTGRQLLQEVGEAERRSNPDHWVNVVRQQIVDDLAAFRKDTSPDAEAVFVVGDCRHVNEIELMRPGLAVRLLGDPAKLRVASKNTKHISETALDDYEDFDLKIDTDVCDKQMVIAAIERHLILNMPDTFGALAASKYLKSEV